MNQEKLFVAGSERNHFHTAVLVRSLDEVYEVLGDFIREGINGGEKSVHVCDPNERHAHLQQMEQLGIRTVERTRAGQLEILGWEDTYLRSGRFDAVTMKAMMTEVVKTTLAEGFPRARFYGHMEWCLDNAPGKEQLIEFEARAEALWTELRQFGVCIYDISRFNGATVLALLKTHKAVVMDGKLIESPFYTPPEQLLKEWKPLASYGAA